MIERIKSIKKQINNPMQQNDKYDCKQSMLGATRCSKQCDECKETFTNDTMNDKFLTTSELRELEKQVSLGEMSYGRMVEVICNKADKHYNQLKHISQEEMKHIINELSKTFQHMDESSKTAYCIGIVDGFNKCAELNAGKEYTKLKKLKG